MSANLRRSLHTDLLQESFRANLERYLGMFSELVEEEWSSFAQLQGFTTGHNLEIMFADRAKDCSLIIGTDAQPEASNQNSRQFRERLCHFMSRAKKGGYYAIPSRSPPGRSDFGSTEYFCFQLLGFKPGNRKYIERITQWATDIWKGKLSCAMLGVFDVQHDGQGGDVQLIPQGKTFKSVVTSVQPVSLEELFDNDNIDHLHEFQCVSHITEFDRASVQDLVQNEEDEMSQDFAILALELVIFL